MSEEKAQRAMIDAARYLIIFYLIAAISIRRLYIHSNSVNFRLILLYLSMFYINIYISYSYILWTLLHRLADELRVEQETAMAIERDRKLLEAQVKNIMIFFKTVFDIFTKNFIQWLYYFWLSIS